jgi:hypothetical protein
MSEQTKFDAWYSSRYGSPRYPNIVRETAVKADAHEVWQAALATQPQAPQYGNCTTMTFGSDCNINGIEVKAGTVVKVCAPTETPEVRHE